MGDDVAFGRSVNRRSGTLKNGDTTDFWLRWTMCWRKIDGNWLIVHDQVSVPVDPQTSRALLNLEPILIRCLPRPGREVSHKKFKFGSPDVDVDRGACGMRRRVGGAAGELGART